MKNKYLRAYQGSCLLLAVLGLVGVWLNWDFFIWAVCPFNLPLELIRTTVELGYYGLAVGFVLMNIVVWGFICMAGTLAVRQRKGWRNTAYALLGLNILLRFPLFLCGMVDAGLITLLVFAIREGKHESDPAG